MIWAIYGQNRRKRWKGASKFQGKLLEQYHRDELFHTSLLTFFWPLWQVLRHNALRKVNSSKNLTVNSAKCSASYLLSEYRNKLDSQEVRSGNRTLFNTSGSFSDWGPYTDCYPWHFSQWGSSWIWSPSHIAYQTRLIPCPCRKYSKQRKNWSIHTSCYLILMTVDGHCP